MIWDRDYALGYKVVDHGHALVIEAINRLNRARTRTDRAGEVASLLPLLSRHLTQQFADDEALLRLLGCPDLGAHAREHAHLLAVLGHLRAEFAAGEEVSSLLMLNLGCYLVAHLRGTDQDDFARRPHRRAA